MVIKDVSLRIDGNGLVCMNVKYRGRLESIIR